MGKGRKQTSTTLKKLNFKARKAEIESLEIGDESPLNNNTYLRSKIRDNKHCHSERSFCDIDSGLGTGSDEEKLNNTEISKNNSDPNSILGSKASRHSDCSDLFDISSNIHSKQNNCATKGEDRNNFVLYGTAELSLNHLKGNRPTLSNCNALLNDLLQESGISDTTLNSSLNKIYVPKNKTEACTDSSSFSSSPAYSSDISCCDTSDEYETLQEITNTGNTSHQDINVLSQITSPSCGESLSSQLPRSICIKNNSVEYPHDLTEVCNNQRGRDVIGNQSLDKDEKFEVVSNTDSEVSASKSNISLSDMLATLHYDNITTSLSDSGSVQENLKSSPNNPLDSQIRFNEHSKDSIFSSENGSDFSDFFSSLKFDCDADKFSKLSFPSESVSKDQKSINLGPNILFPQLSFTQISKDENCLPVSDSGFSDLLSSLCFDDSSSAKSPSKISSNPDNLLGSDYDLNSFQSRILNNSIAENSNYNHKDFSRSFDLSGIDEGENAISLAALAEKHLSVDHTLTSSADILGDGYGSNKLNSIELSKFAVENAENLSMLDLFSAVSTENSLSDVCFGDSSSSLEATKNLPGGEANVGIIDLTACLKSDKPDSISNSVPERKTTDIASEYIPISPTHPFFLVTKEDNVCDAKERKLIIKQSLFGKALACKPKVHNSVIQKVMTIKSEICDHFFNPTLPEEKRNSTKLIINQTNQCVVALLGRRVFGPEAQCLVN